MDEKLSASQRKIKALESEVATYKLLFAVAVSELGGELEVTVQKIEETPAQLSRQQTAQGFVFKSLKPSGGEVV